MMDMFKVFSFGLRLISGKISGALLRLPSLFPGHRVEDASRFSQLVLLPPVQRFCLHQVMDGPIQWSLADIHSPPPFRLLAKSSITARETSFRAPISTLGSSPVRSIRWTVLT
jgi:hypothetical protein